MLIAEIADKRVEIRKDGELIAIMSGTPKVKMSCLGDVWYILSEHGEVSIWVDAIRKV